MPLLRSWIESANTADTMFPLSNLPYGVFSVGDGPKRCGTLVGSQIIDLTGLENAGILRATEDGNVLSSPNWNAFMALGEAAWARYREELTTLLTEDADSAVRAAISAHCIDREHVELHLPITVSEYTDFYAGYHHAVNVGTMFRGAENALPPNWVHMPIGYNGRASSVVVSGTDIRRPWGQLKAPDDVVPRFGPSEKFDIELEIGAIVGQASNGPISVDQADRNIFGYVLLNDWSARDIQAWEYQPLGPFQSKATATSISPWIVTKDALEPFRCVAPERRAELLPHLRDTTPMHYDIPLSVTLNGEPIARTNSRELYYSAAQQLAHHTVSGCSMRTGDLLGSGTISGPTPNSRGSFLELSWNGQYPIETTSGPRSFIEDGDTLALHGAVQGDGFQIGFGDCVGTVVSAGEYPFN